jgi:AraC-like DNA-binding protein
MTIETNERAFDYYPQLKRVRKFVGANYLHPFTMHEVAAAAGMEVKYFSTFFHAKVGICFHDWMNRVRIAKAQEILATEDRQITELAYATGFADLSTFERAFKKVLHLTPREYKKRVRANLLGTF